MMLLYFKGFPLTAAVVAVVAVGTSFSSSLLLFPPLVGTFPFSTRSLRSVFLRLYATSVASLQLGRGVFGAEFSSSSSLLLGFLSFRSSSVSWSTRDKSFWYEIRE